MSLYSRAIVIGAAAAFGLMLGGIALKDARIFAISFCMTAFMAALEIGKAFDIAPSKRMAAAVLAAIVAVIIMAILPMF